MARGRPRKINPDAALDAAMKLFWDKGFDGTSMSELVEVTGMAKPGLYATFGDKQEFYNKALTHYFEDLGSPLVDDLINSTDPIEITIRRFLESVAHFVVDKSKPCGCFVVNNLVDCANSSTAMEMLGRDFDKKRRAAFIACFSRAIDAGQLTCDVDAVALGEFYAGQVIALAVKGRAGAKISDLTDFIDIAMTALPKN